MPLKLCNAGSLLRAACFSAVTLIICPAHADDNALTGTAAELYRKAQGGRWYADAAKLKPEISPTSDGRSFLVVWKKAKEPAHWIFSLHGSNGFATDDLALWQRRIQDRDIGLVCLQWWLGESDGPNAYYKPIEIQREADAILQKLGAKPGAVMLHGFSRGSANSYAVAALDAGRGKHWFSLAVASSGGVGLDFPPNRTLVNGGFGPRPLQDTRWITIAGGHDPHPDRDGIPGMQRAAAWLKEQGAIVVAAIEDPDAGHGALQTNPTNAQRVLDLFLK